NFQNGYRISPCPSASANIRNNEPFRRNSMARAQEREHLAQADRHIAGVEDLSRLHSLPTARRVNAGPAHPSCRLRALLRLTPAIKECRLVSVLPADGTSAALSPHGSLGALRS